MGVSIVQTDKNKESRQEFLMLVGEMPDSVVYPAIHCICSADKHFGTGDISWEKFTKGELNKVQYARVFCDSALLLGISSVPNTLAMRSSSKANDLAFNRIIGVHSRKDVHDADYEECMKVMYSMSSSGSDFDVIANLYKCYIHITEERELFWTFPEHACADIKIYKGGTPKQLPDWVTRGLTKNQVRLLSELYSEFNEPIPDAKNDVINKEMVSWAYRRFLSMLMTAISAMGDNGYVALSYKHMARAYDVCECIPSINNMKGFYRGNENNNVCKDLLERMSMMCRSYNVKRDGEYVMLLLTYLLNEHPLKDIEEIRKHA